MSSPIEPMWIDGMVTNMPPNYKPTLTDRERELVEATKNYILFPSNVAVRDKLTLALRAYDPPKRKYTMPEWGEFYKNIGRGGQNKLTGEERVSLNGRVVYKQDYSAIREALSTEEQ
jgi:hypothetical protein